MLDNEEMKRRIGVALGAAPRGTAAAIARELGITEQAINGWKNTGKIDKTSITALARHTGRRIEYFLDPSVTDEQSNAAESQAGRPDRETLHDAIRVAMASKGKLTVDKIVQAYELISRRASVSFIRELPAPYDDEAGKSHATKPRGNPGAVKNPRREGGRRKK